MKLVHEKYGTLSVDSDAEVRRLAQYGWKPAPVKTSRKRKPSEQKAPAQPELPVAEEPLTDSE